MARTQQLPTKLTDIEAYRVAVQRLTELKAAEAGLREQIAQHEWRISEQSEADPFTALRIRREVQQAIDRISQDLTVVQNSIATQERAVVDARSAASREICGAFQAEHNSALRDAALAVISANHAALRVKRLRDRLSAAEVSLVTLPTTEFRGLGQSSIELCSALASYVNECLEIGVLQRRDVPQEWLRGWGI